LRPPAPTFSTSADSWSADSWSAEWRIPLTNLDITPGDRIRFNLTVRRIAGQRWVMWRPTNGHSYDVDEVGHLELAP